MLRAGAVEVDKVACAASVETSRGAGERAWSSGICASRWLGDSSLSLPRASPNAATSEACMRRQNSWLSLACATVAAVFGGCLRCLAGYMYLHHSNTAMKVWYWEKILIAI